MPRILCQKQNKTKQNTIPVPKWPCPNVASPNKIQGFPHNQHLRVIPIGGKEKKNQLLAFSSVPCLMPNWDFSLDLFSLYPTQTALLFQNFSIMLN